MAFTSNLEISVGGEAVPVEFGEDTTMTAQGDVDVSAWLECCEFEVGVSTGQQGGHGASQATGHRIWSPARFVLRMGKSTAILFEAARRNQRVDLTLHMFHRHHDTGEVIEFWQYRVQMGRLTSVRIVQPNTLATETASLHDYCEIQVVPNVSEGESLTASTSFIDDWAANSAV